MANMILGYQLGLDVPVWSQISSCSNYVQAMGARQSSTSVVPATYVPGTSGVIATGDIRTGYAYGNGTNAYWPYYYDGKPVVGHTGYGNLYDDARDRMTRNGSGVAWWGTGGSNQIDIFDWATKTWRTPNKSANAFNPRYWTSEAGSSNTGGRAHAWTMATIIDPATGDLYWLDSIPSMVWGRWDAANDTFVNTRISGLVLYPTVSLNATEPMTVVRGGGRNIVYYMDCHNVSGQQQYTLRRVDITATRTGGAPFAMSPINVSGISFTHPSTSPNVVYQTQAGMIYDPVRDKLIYVDPGFTNVKPDGSGFQSGAHVHLYEIDPDTGVAAHLTTTGFIPPMVANPSVNPGVQTGIWVNTYLSQLGGLALMLGFEYDAATNPNSGAGTIYFIKTH
jgi:hypothetical protein